MKTFFLVFLAIVVIVLGFSVVSLRSELRSVGESTIFYKKRSADLQSELIRINRAYEEKERFLDEIEHNIVELENKVNLEILKKYVPKKTWSEIKPIIDSLKALHQEGTVR